MQVELQPNLRVLIRADGKVEPFNRQASTAAIARMIGADGIDVVNLRKFGLVMLVDDTGLIDGKPANPEATRQYHSVCRPGTTQHIAGDVAIVPDEDFA
jgi:hypothetical protein